MRLHLITPERKADSYIDVAPLGLMIIASLTPPDVDVVYTNTRLEEIDYDQGVDLVGISVLTSHAPHAYRIATQYRKRGIPVVLGGVHPSMLPEEAIQHCDTVVIGEAETIWPKVIEDCRAGTLHRFYRPKGFSDLKELPIPRRELFKKYRYMATNVIQATRGCPFDCEFCTVTAFSGKRHRCRPLDEVETEIQSLDRDKPTFFVDDNIAASKPYARELFQMLIPYKLTWVGQASITIANDIELLHLAKRSGCLALVIGFESLNASNIRLMEKHINRVEQYSEAIRRIHACQIGVMGSFILGYDYDDETTFAKTVEFAKRTDLEFAQFPILMPLPGSRLYRRFCEENRIIDRDWGNYDGTKVVFQPRLMSPQTLHEGARWAYKEFYSYASIVKRLLGNWNSIDDSGKFFVTNLQLRRTGFRI